MGEPLDYAEALVAKLGALQLLIDVDRKQTASTVCVRAWKDAIKLRAKLQKLPEVEPKRREVKQMTKEDWKDPIDAAYADVYRKERMIDVEIEKAVAELRKKKVQLAEARTGLEPLIHDVQIEKIKRAVEGLLPVIEEDQAGDDTGQGDSDAPLEPGEVPGVTGMGHQGVSGEGETPATRESRSNGVPVHRKFTPEQMRDVVVKTFPREVWFTTLDAAKEANVNRSTAKKRLDELLRMGVVEWNGNPTKKSRFRLPALPQ